MCVGLGVGRGLMGRVLGAEIYQKIGTPRGAETLPPQPQVSPFLRLQVRLPSGSR